MRYVMKVALSFIGKVKVDMSFQPYTATPDSV